MNWSFAIHERMIADGWQGLPKAVLASIAGCAADLRLVRRRKVEKR